ncbi:YaeQ family protein [Neptunicella sp. SCSIO 80796]|uniref:YaeQ family protein n=1 Tax=Neptunicella plasticusilytica TaxID=3117012 RepID=UPI003A4D2346
MALKPTIYKIRIALSDLNRDYYDTLNLTIALHPSETVERMMARVLAYCINAQESLVFTKGLSEIDEPDIWVKEPDDRVSVWVEVGEPALDRLKKASHQASQVNIYSFNSKSDTWWQQLKSKCAMLPVSIFQFDWLHIQALAQMVQRTMDISVTITGESAYIATQSGECEVNWRTLQD